MQPSKEWNGLYKWHMFFRNLEWNNTAMISPPSPRPDPSPSQVNLSGNVLGDAGCAAIAACLPRATALRSLWLCHNGIGSTGAAALAAALQQNIARLTALFPDCSRLVDAGVEQSSPKPHSVGLTALFLAGNPLIGEEGGEHGMKLLRIACWPAGVRQDLY